MADAQMTWMSLQNVLSHVPCAGQTSVTVHWQPLMIEKSRALAFVGSGWKRPRGYITTLFAGPDGWQVGGAGPRGPHLRLFLRYPERRVDPMAGALEVCAALNTRRLCKGRCWSCFIFCPQFVSTRERDIIPEEIAFAEGSRKLCGLI